MSHANYLPVRPDWLGRRHEAAIDPDLPIIDAHHHLWDRPGWRYLLPELMDDIRDSGHLIEQTVFMQCQTMYRTCGPEAMRPVGETAFVASLAGHAAGGPVLACAGIVGHADLRLGGAVGPVLEAHIRAGEGRFRGIRHISVWDADASLMNPLSAGPPGVLRDAVFREGFAALRPRDLSFDAWLFHPQLDELVDLARSFPDTTIILDHLGGVLGIGPYAGQRDAVFLAWAGAIRMLAACPNVVVKLGGLGMRINGFGFEEADQPPTSERLAATWRPYMETCIEAFGAKRCMFQSNFPVDKGFYGYGTVWNAFKRLSRGAGEDERTALFSGTARRIYRLGATDRD